MTKEQVESLNLGIAPVDSRTILTIESAFNWINDNTTLSIDCNDYDALDSLPSNVKLFIIEYFDIMTMSAGVTSESLGGMSQSFDSSTKSSLLWQYAEELLGRHMKSQMTFVEAKNQWQ